MLLSKTLSNLGYRLQLADESSKINTSVDEARWHILSSLKGKMSRTWILKAIDLMAWKKKSLLLWDPGSIKQKLRSGCTFKTPRWPFWLVDISEKYFRGFLIYWCLCSTSLEKLGHIMTPPNLSSVPLLLKQLLWTFYVFFLLCHFFLNENVILESFSRCFRPCQFCQSRMALCHLCQYIRVIDWEILLTDNIDHSHRTAQTSR